MNAISTDPRAAGQGHLHGTDVASPPLTRLLGGAFVAAPLLILASSVAWAAGSDGARGVLQFYGAAVFVLVLVTLASALAPQLPRAAAVIAVAGVLGYVAGAAFAIDELHVALQDGVHLADGDAGIAGALVTNVPGLLGPVAWVAIGVGLRRTGLAPGPGAMLILAGVLFPVSRIGEIAALAVVDDMIFLAALVPLGWAIAQGRGRLAQRAGRI